MFSFLQSLHVIISSHEVGSCMCLWCFRVRRHLRLPRRRRLNLLSAHFLKGYLVDFVQTSHAYSLGQGAVQTIKTVDLTYFLRSQKWNFDFFGAPYLILWFPKDNLWMPSRIFMKFGIHTYFIGASPGIGARQNSRIFNEAAALRLVETYRLITLFL